MILCTIVMSAWCLCSSTRLDLIQYRTWLDFIYVIIRAYKGSSYAIVYIDY
jgi:hypothetical protein